MQGLSRKFEEANPDIQLRWVVLEENVLRQRVTLRRFWTAFGRRSWTSCTLKRL